MRGSRTDRPPVRLFEALATAPSGHRPVPREVHRTMPPQSLTKRPPQAVRAGRHDYLVWPLRLILFCASTALTVYLAQQMHLVLSLGGMTVVEHLMLGLFVVNIAWISLSFVSCTFGFISLLTGAHKRPAERRPLSTRTALLLPTYNEDPARIAAAGRAILEDVARTGEGGAFDLFVLSDTTDPEIWLEEEETIARMRAEWHCASGIYYRHRLRNTARKAGNIADFCERWGAAYQHMIVLDADSLMSGRTVVELARRMEQDPEAGIIQTIPRLINRSSLLARMQQFATRVYGPVVGAGLSTWHGNASNYWGHNAIIRTRAFTDHAGLPELSGRPPFGGHILSHDFVEAALVRRAGYKVRIDADLNGSYEECPTNLIDLGVRDRRWCQGNLQHARLLTAAGLHPLSRLHLFWGIMSYLAAPFWMLFLFAGIGLAVQASLIRPDYFPDGFSLFPHWPRIDAERARTLFGISMAVLLAPKLMGLIVFILDENGARKAGGAVRAAFSTLLETILSALIAPITMMIQTKAIIQILMRQDSGWNPQARDDGSFSWKALLHYHRGHVVAGMLFGAAAAAFSLSLFLWMLPALIGLMFAIPLSAMMASGRLGRALRRASLLSIPEEVAPCSVIARANELMKGTPSETASPLARLLDDERLRELHFSYLDTANRRRPGEIDPALATARLKIDDLGERETILEALTSKEQLAVLKCADTLRSLIGLLSPPVERLRASS